MEAFNVLRLSYLVRALALDFAAEALSPVLRGTFPAKHWLIKSLYCDITLAPPPLFGPEPLSTASVKQVSQVGAWLTLAAAGAATAGAASAATTAAIATVLGLVTIVMSLPVFTSMRRSLGSASIQVPHRHEPIAPNRSVK